jgi:formiminotetrahydrofolate cyclodeaminase
MDDQISELPARELVERLASGEPIPGGGSASAMAGAMGAALVQMVVALTSGRPGAAESEGELTEIAVAAATCQSELVNLADLDAAAYAEVVRARRLSKETERDREARAVQVAAATREATRAPMQAARLAATVLDLAERLAPIGNRNAISDVGVAALLAAAAVRGAALNVRINLPYLDVEEPLRDEAAGEVDRLLAGLDERERAIRDAVEARLG